MKQDLKDYIISYDVCQKCKSENVPYPSLLQPLPILYGAWKQISADFIKGLLNSEGKTTILVVVDTLTMYGHFLALSHPYSAINVANAFIREIYNLHGFPEAIISDRDKVFTSIFWKELFKIASTQLKMSLAYHL